MIKLNLVNKAHIKPDIKLDETLAKNDKFLAARGDD